MSIESEAKRFVGVCRDCKGEYEVRTFTKVDACKTPKLALAIMESNFVVECPYCGGKSQLQHPMYFFDVENNIVLVYSQYWNQAKKMAEDICEYFEMNLIKVRYIHHNVETMERQELIRDLRLGVYDVLIGVNLLREGLDIPEVSLVAILDADKEGFLRSKTSLVQTIGRAARNADGTVIMYADSVTESMAYAIGETERRRKIQTEYNEKHGIVPQTVKKEVRAIIEIASRDDTAKNEKKAKKMTKAEKESLIESLTKEMKAASAALDFEHAAHLRDMIAKLKK